MRTLWYTYVLTAPWWTNQPKSNIKKIPPEELRPISFSFGYFKVTKMKKMGCFRGSKRATVSQSHMYKKHHLSYLWSKLNGILKFGIKVGVKSIFHFMTFFDGGQITELLTFLVLRLKCTVTLLELRKHPIFFILVTLKYQKLKKFGRNFVGGIFLIFGLIYPPGSCAG